jgi:sulfite exporter TauE/SafE
MLGPLLAAFLAGLLGSVHCVAMCGAFAASCARTRAGLPAWHLGRILSYTLLGAVAGSAGALLPGPAWLPGLLATLLLGWFALALAGVAPEPRLVPASLTHIGARAARRDSPGAQLLFGVVNGFLPCGLVYSALTIPVALASPARGAAAMLAFGAGTTPALTLAALGLRRLLLATPVRRRVFAALVLAIGLWTIWARTTSPASGGAHHRPPMPAAGHRTGEH